MQKSIMSAAIISCMLLLNATANALPASGSDSQNVGSSLFGGTITYQYTKIGARKYTLVASAFNGIDNTPSVSQLVSNFKEKAVSMCAPDKASTTYKIGSFSRKMEMSSGSYTYAAPQVTGIVTCR